MLRNPIFRGGGLSPSWSAHELSDKKTNSVNSSLSLIAIAYTFANMSCKLCRISEIHFTNSNYQSPTILLNGGRQPELLLKISSGCIKGLGTPSQNRKNATKFTFFLTTWRALDASRQRWACASNTVDLTVVSCADPGIFVMWRVGGPGSTDRKKTLITFS